MPEHTQDLGQMPESSQHHSSLGHDSDQGGSQGETRGRRFVSVDSKESPSTPVTVARKLGKMMPVRVQMLDDSITLFQVQTKAPGKILFEQVCKQLNLLEVDYFGLEYHDSQGISYWLDVDKQMNHQVSLNTGSEPLLRFCVKFYTPDPAQVEEEYTRYLFSLQIKRDLSCGLLQCNDNTAALLASYIVQAECGDYVVEDYPDHTYLSTYKFVPHQDAELEVRIMENHKKHIGLSPAEADLNLLETARRCELYGTKMHPAKDHEGVPLNLAVAHMGVIVFQNYTKINTFSWAKIRKLSFKRKKYLIKLHPEGYGYYKDTVEFYFEDRNHCKNFWKKCVEHHSFFRCLATSNREREKHRLLSKGSSFRYSGKTQKQMQEFVRDNFVKRQSFQRQGRSSQSGRLGLCGSVGNVGQGLSGQPLLPIREHAATLYRFDQHSQRKTSMGNDQTFRTSPGQYFSHHSLPHNASQFHTNNTTFQSAHSTPRTRALQGEAEASYTTPSLPYRAGQTEIYSTNEEEDDEADLMLRNSSQGYRHSIHGGDVFTAAILEGSMTAGENNASEITVIENRPNNWSSPRRGSSSNQSRTSINSNTSFKRTVPTGYQIVVQGVSGPVAHDVHSDHEEEDEEDCQVSSEDNLSHDSYELIEKEGGSHGGSKENIMNSMAKMSSPPNVSSTSLELPLGPGGQPLNPCPPVAFPRNKSNDSFSQESDHNASINKLARINNLLMDNNCSSLSATPLFASDTDDFQGHEVTLQRPPQTPEERMMVDIVRKRGLQLQMKPTRQAANHANNNNSNGTRSLPRYLTQRDPDLVSGPPPTAYPFGRKHVYNYTSRTLPNNQRIDKSPVYYSRGGLLGPTGECSSGSSSSHASPKISRPKSLEFAALNANALTNQGAYSYRDDSLDKPNNMIEYDDSSISAACGGGPLLQYATSSSDVPQTPENPNYPHLPVDIAPTNYAMYYNDEHIYDVPESIEPADIISPSSSSGITDSFPRASMPLGFDHYQHQQQQQQQHQQQQQLQQQQQQQQQQAAPPLPREAPPPLPLHPQPLKAPRFNHQVGFTDPPEQIAPKPRTHFMNSPRVKSQDINQKVFTHPKSVHMLISMSSTESESALSARSAPTPVVGIMEERVPSSLEEMPEPMILLEASNSRDDNSEVQAISVNLISPPEESESSTAVMDSEGRIPAPPPEFSGAAVINQGDLEEATDIDDDEDNEEDKSGSPSLLKQNNEPIETATVSQESEYVTVVPRQMHRGNSLRCFKADSLDIVDGVDEDNEQHSSILSSEQHNFFEHEDFAFSNMDERAKMITFNEEDEYIDDDDDDANNDRSSSPDKKEEENVGTIKEEIENNGDILAPTEENSEENESECESKLQERDIEPEVEILSENQSLEVVNIKEESDIDHENHSDLKVQSAEQVKKENVEVERVDDLEQDLGEENNQELEDDDEEEEDHTDEFEIDVNAADDYDSNTMIRVKDKVVAGKVELQKDESAVNKNETIDNEPIEEVTEFKSPPKTSDEEKSPSNEEEESEVIKIGEMYVRLDNGSTLSENLTAEDDEVSNLEEEIVEHYTESGKQVECVVKVCLPVIQQPVTVFIPSPSPEPSSEQNTKTEDTTPKMNRLPSLPTGDSASSLGLDLIPPPPVSSDDICIDETIAFPSPPPELAMFESSSEPSTPRVTILPSSPAPEGPVEVYCVSIPPRALSRISERSNSDAAHNQHQLSPRSASPPSEASKGPAEDTMSDQNYTSSEDNDNPPSLCSDLPDNANHRQEVRQLPQYQSEEEVPKDQFPSPPSSLLEGTVTIQECGTEVTHIEPDSMFLELSPPDDEDEGEYELALHAEASNASGNQGGTLERRREKIPYDFSISSENGVTNKEDEDSQSSLHGSMEILEEVATADHFDHDSTNTDTDDDADKAGAQMPRDIFEMAPLDTALEERGAMGQQRLQQQQLQIQQHQQDNSEPSEPCDLFELPPMRSRGNEYIL